MPKPIYCWRCRMDIPMLDEAEWAEVQPLLANALEEIERYRAEHGVSLDEAKRVGYGKGALEHYFQITGFRETNANALWHHRLSLYGPPCGTCGKPLRTPRAKLCAECGATAESPTPG